MKQITVIKLSAKTYAHDIHNILKHNIVLYVYVKSISRRVNEIFKLYVYYGFHTFDIIWNNVLVFKCDYRSISIRHAYVFEILWGSYAP